MPFLVNRLVDRGGLDRDLAFYAISALGFGVSLLSVQRYDFQNTAFVAYVFLMNGACAALASRGRGDERGPR